MMWIRLDNRKSGLISIGEKNMMRHLRTSVVVVFAVCVSALMSHASTIDQSFTSSSNEGDNINECCAFIAQTYTAGLSGSAPG
jgi:hypothetical protein